MQSVLHGHFSKIRLCVTQQYIDRQWKKRCCLKLRRVTVCTMEMIAELGYAALWFQGDSRHAAMCAAQSTKHSLCCEHPQGCGQGQWDVWTFYRMYAKEGFSCRCHLAKEQYALHMTCFSLSATRKPPHTHWTFKLLGRDELSPCVHVSKGVWAKPACVLTCV